MSRPKPLAPFASSDDTEHQFYEALQRGDLERLMAVWSDDDDIACVQPGGPRLIGSAAIRESFKALFARGPLPAVPEKVRRVIGLTSAVHSVLERIHVKSADGVQTAWVVSTNVYVKTAQGWRLVAHHASPAAPGEVQELLEASATLH